MNWILLTSIGLASFARASPTTTPSCSLTYPAETCSTKTIPNITANFDDRDVGSKLNSPYHHLTFVNLTVKDQGTGHKARGVIPASSPHYAIAPPRPPQAYPYQYLPQITITGTKTTSFDFHSVYLGCLSANNTKSGYIAVECVVDVDCASSLSQEGHYGPTLYTYTPSGPTGAEMMFVEPYDYNYCQDASFQLYSSGGGYFSTLIVVDSFNYTIRQGEANLG